MKIIVVGTGVIGSAVVSALRDGGHTVVACTRKSDPSVDLENAASIAALFERVKDVDAVVSCAGSARFKPFAELTDDDFDYTLRNKLMGQVNLTRAALRSVRDGGSVTLTSGVLAAKPMPGSGAVSLVNAGLEGFGRAAALEAPRGIRVNVVSPGWVRETLEQLKMDPSWGLPARDIARAYVAAVTGSLKGETLDPAKFLG